MTPTDGWIGLVGAVAFALGWDTWAIPHHHQSASRWAGTHPVVIAVSVAYLLCHFNGWPKRFARFDPLAVLGRRLTPIN